MPRAVWQIANRRFPRCPSALQRGLGLRHVGAGDLANPEAIVCGLELLRQHLLVVDLQIEQLLRLDDTDIGADGVVEAGLLLRDQRGALRHHLVLGAVDVGRHLAAGIEVLGDRGLGRGDLAIGSGSLMICRVAPDMKYSRVRPSP